MSSKLSDYLRIAREHIAADKKKSAVLAILLVVLLVVLGRVLIGGSAPKKLEAVTVAPAPINPNSTGITMRPIPQPQGVLKGPAPVQVEAADSGSLPQPIPNGILNDLPRTLARDIFSAPDWSLFPEADDPAAGTDGASGFHASRLWSKLTESMNSLKTQQADEFESQLSTLKLHATVTGTTPIAYVSGRIVREGDLIDGFSVVRISERRVTLRKFGHTGSIELP